MASQKEKDLLKILDNLPDGLFTMDKEGKITYFNAAAERITGILSRDAMGIHCRDIFKTTTCRTGRTGKNDAPIEKNAYNKEFFVTTLDGRKLFVTSSISVLKDHDGKVIGGVQVFKDTSDRKHLEDDLRLSESKYRRIFEGSKDIIFITAKDGTIRDVNQASVDSLSYGSKDEFLSLQSIEKVYDNPMHWRVFKKQIDRHGFVRDFEAGFKRKDGARMHCLLSGNAVRNEEDGEIIGYEGIAKDITPRMDAIRNLQRSHRELSLLNAVALAMNATEDLNDILMTALANVLDLLNLASGGIFLIDHNRPGFFLRAQRGLLEKTINSPYELHLLDQTLMKSLLKKDLILEPKSDFPPFAARLKKQDVIPSTPLTCFFDYGQGKSVRIPRPRPAEQQGTHRPGPSPSGVPRELSGGRHRKQSAAENRS